MTEPIKKDQNVKKKERDYSVWIVGSVMVAVVISLIVLFVLKKKKVREDEPPKRNRYLIPFRENKPLLDYNDHGDDQIENQDYESDENYQQLFTDGIRYVNPVCCDEAVLTCPPTGRYHLKLIGSDYFVYVNETGSDDSILRRPTISTLVKTVFTINQIDDEKGLISYHSPRDYNNVWYLYLYPNFTTNGVNYSPRFINRIPENDGNWGFFQNKLLDWYNRSWILNSKIPSEKSSLRLSNSIRCIVPADSTSFELIPV